MDNRCDIPIYASTTLTYPLLAPLSLVLIDIDVKRDCAQELMNLSALLAMLSKGGRHSEEEESHHSARAKHPQSEGHKAHGPF